MPKYLQTSTQRDMFARPCLKFFLLFPKFKPLSWNFACRLSSSGNFLAFHWQGFEMDQPICRVWLWLDKYVCLEFKSHCSEYPTWLRCSIEVLWLPALGQEAEIYQELALMWRICVLLESCPNLSNAPIFEKSQVKCIQ